MTSLESSGLNAGYVEQLLEQYLDNPEAVDPAWRAVLARRAGRIVFAGEHTSERWQGYMNGAVETGQRAARELIGGM